MKYLFIYYILLLSFSLNAQIKFDYNWMFGYQNSEIPNIYDGVNIDFNTTPSDTTPVDMPFPIYLSNATMSDEQGNLLFYTNGCFVANRNHEIMMNGDSINPGDLHDFSCYRGYSGGKQNMVVIPIPNQSNKYYLFHKSSTFDDVLVIYSNRLYFTLIDMTLDNGLGGVVEKNSIMLEDTLRAGEMTAIKHTNGEDWWLVLGKDETNQFIKYLISGDTIEGPFFQGIGLPVSDEGSASGQIIFSPDGTKFARYNKIDHVYLYDFDRSTGLFSNFQHIFVDSTISSGGCAISSNSRFLYVTTVLELFQFDLEADNIEESKVLIDVYDGYVSMFPTPFNRMQLAPDCRIFMNSQNAVDVLHVINNPNEKGVACNFEQHSFPLPTPHQFSMPHFPYYRMDTDYPICDSSLVVSSTEVFRGQPKQEMRVFPNPAREEVTVVFDEVLQTNMEVRIYNMMGQLVHQKLVEKGMYQANILMPKMPKGMYCLKLGTGDSLLFSVF
jgi:hypothetical protein